MRNGSETRRNTSRSDTTSTSSRPGQHSSSWVAGSCRGNDIQHPFIVQIQLNDHRNLNDRCQRVSVNTFSLERAISIRDNQTINQKFTRANVFLMERRQMSTMDQ